MFNIAFLHWKRQEYETACRLWIDYRGWSLESPLQTYFDLQTSLEQKFQT